jgi:hypothetical protein
VRIFVTNFNPEHDYDVAEEMGETVMMTHGFIPAARLSKTMETFDTYARQASPDDALLLSGANIVCVLAIAAWLRHHPTVTVMQHTKVKDGSTFRTSYIKYDVSR